MELLGILEGNEPQMALVRTRSARELKEDLLKVEHSDDNMQRDPKRRIGLAHDEARELLKGAAQMTDAYFLYTPSQIWMAALLIADEPLARYYLDVKIPSLPDSNGGAFLELRKKLLATLAGCAALLRSYEPGTAQKLKELKRIDKKLYQCQNPEKVDLIELNKAQKREGANDSDAEKALKKRKLERTQLEKDGDVFGGDLKG